ncbi:ABC transporter ATP-binding protein [Propionivibrio dicarboxylicus]|uniref:Cyclolysin secretion/processing ATP-binding protein CyaB n=1 Tax=Propionivibrio dicarboxylicus TaxID=83767 RepID=A0A1G8J064_9RHOO|nr:ABC transporter ATP-binding protein [Propionivibrio dicarboxylicus]SDI24675.1 ATP-binding cassette, subfamily B [Propionivibrio dicarboxylicus]
MTLTLLGSLVFEAALDSATRYSFRILIDEAIVPRDSSMLILVLTLLGVATVLFSALALVADYLWAKLGTLVINDLRRDLYRHVQRLSIEFFGKRSSGDVLNCFLADAETVENCLVTVVPYALTGVFSVTFATLFMASIQPWMALLAVLGVAACFLLPRTVLWRARQASLDTRRQSGRLSATIQEGLQGQSVIKAFGLEHEVYRRFNDETNILIKLSIRSSFLSYVVQRIPSVSFFILALIILGISSVLALQGHLSSGEIVSFQILVLGLNTAISNLTWLAPVMIEATASMERLNEIFREQPTVAEAEVPVCLPPFQRELRLDSVSFAYPHRAADSRSAALQDISVVFRRGEFSVLVGPSGSGKTTLLQLLLRLYDPSRGRILFDGNDIRDASIDSLRTQFGLVSQDVLLFDLSLRDNIRMGKLDATDTEILEALRSAEILDFVLALPAGLDTLVGERGARFSGGERQRLILARALVRRPAILILDEATSALDVATEAELLATLRRLAETRRITLIAVTHRLSLAALADHVYVLNNGRLACGNSDDEVPKSENCHVRSNLHTASSL